MNNIRDIEFLKKFGNNLKVIRNQKKLSQEILAFTSDIPISQIGRIERGEINTTISTILAISRALQIDIKELFDFNEEREVH